MITNKTVIGAFKEFIDNHLQNNRNLIQIVDLFKVTDVHQTTYKVNIQSLANKFMQFENVPVMGVGLGAFKGLMALPQPGDLVLAAYLGENRPIVLGTLFNSLNVLSQVNTEQDEGIDVVPSLNETEALWAPRKKGSFILFTQDNDIIISNSTRSMQARFFESGQITITGGDITINGGTIHVNGDIVNLGDSATLAGVARLGDAVEVLDPISGVLVGTITSASGNVKAGD